MSATDERAASSSSDEEIEEEQLPPEITMVIERVIVPPVPPEPTLSLAEQSTAVVPPPSPRSVTLPARLPLAVSILSDPERQLKELLKSATMMVPEIFMKYNGAGGESLRALHHSVLAEYRANAEDTFVTQGSLKCALFVAFVDLCVSFTPEATEESCRIIHETARELLDSIRALFKSDARQVIEGYAPSAAQKSIAEQLQVMTQFYTDRFDTRRLVSDGTPMAMPAFQASPDGTMNIFMILHACAEARDTTFFRHARNVRDRVQMATQKTYIYVAGIFLRYFYFTLIAVCRLARADWQKTLTMIAASTEEEAAIYFQCKIDSRLRSNFDDLCSYMLAAKYAIEPALVAEHARFQAHVRGDLPLPPPPAADRFRPQPFPEEAQQGSSCAIL